MATNTNTIQLTAIEAAYADGLFECCEFHSVEEEAVWMKCYDAAEAGRSVKLTASEAAIVLAQFGNTESEWDARTGNRLYRKLAG